MRGRHIEKLNASQRLEKAHVSLMRNKHTALFSGVMLMGDSKIVDDCPTAKTDGLNKYYGREFVDSLTDSELRALVLHENIHVALGHMPRFRSLMKKGKGQLVNIACDYVDNDVIVSIDDESFVKLPKGGLYDSKYHDWSVNDILKDLEKEQKENPEQFAQKHSEGTLDEHDAESLQVSENTTALESGDMKSAQQKVDESLAKEVEEAMRQGGILAGKLGGNIPRSITDMLTPVVDWKDVLRDFITSSMRGSDEYTWRRFNKRHMANDLYLPSVEDESVGELIVAIDTSGSVGKVAFDKFVSEIESIAINTEPEKLRVIWWDANVSSEQVFTPSNYHNMVSLLKSSGGGGTEPDCVAKYITEKKINAEAIIMFTDGHFSKPVWNVSTPSLWVVTESDRTVPSSCKVVKQLLDN
jgi:predicted metal-dependent peptidase